MLDDLQLAAIHTVPELCQPSVCHEPASLVLISVAGRLQRRPQQLTLSVTRHELGM
jgi:hypothetical protein